MSTFLNEPFIDDNRAVGILESKVLRTLLYFDIFHHPLSADEIRQYLLLESVDKESISETLQTLSMKRLIFFKDNFYALRKAELLAERRIKGEREAARALKTAQKYSRLMAAFPFVRGICISGSLSKGYMDATTDIDYFIITHPGRLWLARTLLVLFKKIFLFNSRKYFCVNYFIASDSLQIPDQNIFTAIETAFLIPTYNHHTYHQLLRANGWVRNYFPNSKEKNAEWCIREKKLGIKKALEKIFSGSFGEELDTFCFRLTLKFWKRKFKEFDETTFDHRLRSRKNVSKHHPQGFQEKVLRAYEQQVRKFEDQHAMRLD